MLLNGKKFEKSRGIFIEKILIYNPTKEPEKAKPLEEDIQDAKLLYFYPEQTDINVKRNLVGLFEGIVTFWGSFSPEKPDNDSFIGEYNEHFLIIKKIEGDLWMAVYFAFEEIDVLDKNDKISQFDSSTEEIVKDDFIKEQMFDMLYQQFFRFYGPLSNFLNEKGEFKGYFLNLFEAYYERFCTFYSINGDSRYLYPLNFTQTGLPRFAIRKNMFLLSNHLDVILSESSRNSLENNCLFYKGYFIYSSLPYDQCLSFYNYFYGEFDSIRSKEDKFLSRHYDSRLILSDHREHIKNLRFGYCIKEFERDGMLMGSAGNLEFCPEYFTKDDDGVVQEKQFVAFKVKGFLLIMVLKKGHGLERSDFSLIKDNVTKLLSSSADSFEQQLLGYEEFYKKRSRTNMLIYNCMNLSFTKAPVFDFTLGNLPDSLMLYLSKIIEESLRKERNYFQMTMRIGSHYVFLYHQNSRLIMISNIGSTNQKAFDLELAQVIDGMKDIFI